MTNGAAPKERYIPGLAPAEPEKEKKSRRKKKDKGEKQAQAQSGAKTGTAPQSTSDPAPSPPVAAAIPIADGGSGPSHDDLKKQRALLKKLRAIEELKLRQASGETLEKTQLQKIEKEKEIAAELAKLGLSD